MKKVLFISYLFPPVGGGGVLRVAKFTKYLPLFGYEPNILTVRKPFHSVQDESLLAEIPKAVKINRIGYFEPANWFKNQWWQAFLVHIIYPIFLIPDRQALWILPAVANGLRLIKQEKIKILFTSSSSYSDHVVALILKRLTKVAWVADFRDEWTSSHYFRFPTFLHKGFACILEKKILENASRITTISDGLTTVFQKKLGQKFDKFQTIYNGFDPEDFIWSKKHQKHKKCLILYAGSLYGSRRADNFFQALSELKFQAIEPVFLGQNQRVSHREAINRMQQADILLLLLSPHDSPLVFTGKIFEYLATRKPILALAPADSGAAQLVKKLKAGEIADPDNIAQIKEKIQKMYQLWRKNSLKTPSANIEIYNRKNLTGKLAQTFDQLLIKNKIKVCLIGNLQSPQNIHLVNYFKKMPEYEIHFITYKPNKIPGIKSCFVPHRESTNTFSAVKNHYRTAKRIKASVRKIKPDIIHGQGLNFSGIWAMLTGFKPLIVTVWGSDVANYEKFILPERWLIKKTLNQAKIITVTSLATSGQKAIEIGADREKIHLVHFGIDLNLFRKESTFFLKKKFGLANKKIIFCPRSHKPLYNIDVLIDAFGQALKEEPRAMLALVEGNKNDPWEKNLSYKIKELKLQDKILLLSRVQNDKMVDYYNLADVVVSIPSSDGCSVSFLEAMACEKKIVVTRLSYIKEWVFNTQTKRNNLWTVPVRDTVKTAQALLSAIKISDTEFAPIGRKNRQLVASRAEVKQNFAKLDELYRSLLD